MDHNGKLQQPLSQLGIPDLDPKGNEVEDWIITNQMVLINRADEPNTYYSRAWRKTSCPDIANATDDMAKITERRVEQLGGSDHKPAILVVKAGSATDRHKTVPKLELKKSKLARIS